MARHMQNRYTLEEIFSLIKVLEGICVVGTLTGDVAVARSGHGSMSTNQGAEGDSG